MEFGKFWNKPGLQTFKIVSRAFGLLFVTAAVSALKNLLGFSLIDFANGP
jgi:hypothetical protein